MDGLRWLLLLFGIAAIAGVYIYSRRERNKPDAQHRASRLEPSLDHEIAQSGQAESDSADSSDMDADRTRQKIVTLRLIARDGGFFRVDFVAQRPPALAEVLVVRQAALHSFDNLAFRASIEAPLPQPVQRIAVAVR